MSAKDDLSQARAEMLAVLDEKLAKLPEWKAFRAIDKALNAVRGPSTNGAAPPSRKRGRSRTIKGVKSYAELAAEAFNASRAPLTTPEMVKFISARRKVSSNPKKAQVNIQVALSRDKTIRSVPWRNGRAWWFANREPPKESAGLSTNS